MILADRLGLWGSTLSGTTSFGTYTSSATSSRADTSDGGDDTKEEEEEEEEEDDDGGVKVSMTDMLYIRPLATYIKWIFLNSSFRGIADDKAANSVGDKGESTSEQDGSSDIAIDNLGLRNDKEGDVQEKVKPSSWGEYYGVDDNVDDCDLLLLLKR